MSFFTLASAGSFPVLLLTDALVVGFSVSSFFIMIMIIVVLFVLFVLSGFLLS
jgi:uncharacterized protein HemY